MKKLLSYVGFALLLSLAAPLSVQASTVSNALIKGTGPSVYWVAQNGSRYSFPNVKTFWSWFTSDMFNQVKLVADSELAQYPLAGNVTYRPGYKFVKITTDPKVYAVSRGSVLHWVTTEALAKAFFGADWNTKVEDVPDTFFTNYTIGSPIKNVWDYNVGNEYTGVATPSDNLTTAPVNVNAALTLSLSSAHATKNENVTLRADISSVSIDMHPTIELRDDKGTLVLSCQDKTSCGTSVAITGTDATRTFHAVAHITTSAGNKTVESNLTTLRLEIPNVTLKGSAMAESEIYPDANGEPVVRVTATAINMSITDPNVFIRIYDSADNHLIGTCTGLVSCAATESFAGITSARDANFFAIVSDNLNQTLPAAVTTVSLQPKANLVNYNTWVFTATDMGGSTVLNQDQAAQSNLFTLQDSALSLNGKLVSGIDSQSAIPANSTVHLSATVASQNAGDTLTVELRDTAGTAYKTCTGISPLVCASDISPLGEYKNRFFLVRVHDQMNRLREFRLAPAYLVGGNGFGGNVRILADKTTLKRGDTLQFSTKISEATSPISELTTNIYNLESGVMVSSCTWTTECKTKTLVDMAPGKLTYYAVVFDRQGRELAVGFLPTTITVSP